MQRTVVSIEIIRVFSKLVSLLVSGLKAAFGNCDWLFQVNPSIKFGSADYSDGGID